MASAKALELLPIEALCEDLRESDASDLQSVDFIVAPAPEAQDRVTADRHQVANYR
jgi:hypothetical protein